MDAWESQEPGYQPSLCVLQHLERAVNAACAAPDQAAGGGRAQHPAATQGLAGDVPPNLATGAWTAEGTAGAGQQVGSVERGEACSGGQGAASSSGRGSAGEEGGERVRSMLLCGADMVESLVVPGVWRPEHVRAILADHGVVCIDRRVHAAPNLGRFVQGQR